MDRFLALETFVRVVDRGGFSAAAQDLRISRAMVSRHVQELEARLGAVAEILLVDHPSVALDRHQHAVASARIGVGEHAGQRRSAGQRAHPAANDVDGRVVMVEITEAGRSRHADVNERRGELMTHMLGAFTPEERPVLAYMLERFVSAVDEFVDRRASPQGAVTTR